MNGSNCRPTSLFGCAIVVASTAVPFWFVGRTEPSNMSSVSGSSLTARM